MDLFARAVDWVVTRKANEGPSADDAVANWESLPGDIFSALLSHFDTLVDNASLKALRCVCSTWKHNIDARLQRLSLRVEGDWSRHRVSNTFESLRSLNVLCAFDAPVQNSFVLEDFSRCSHLERLVLKNCKGKIMTGLQQLSRFLNLLELQIDGDIFQKMQQSGIALTQLEKLCLYDCSKFTNSDYQHLTSFKSVESLSLFHVTSQWKCVPSDVTAPSGGVPCRLSTGFLSEMKELTDLTVVQSSIHQETPLLGCLAEAHGLKRLVLCGAGLMLESLQSLPSMPFLEQLMLDGCMVVSPQVFQCLAIKCPKLKCLALMCPSEAWIARDFTPCPEMSHLQELKIVHSHPLNVASLSEAFSHDVQISSVRNADSILQRATRTGDIPSIEAVLKSAGLPGAPVSREYFTPSILWGLASKGRYDVMKLMVEYGADIDYGNPAYAFDADESGDCSTALHFAVHRGDAEGVRALLNLGARVDAHCTEDGRTPLHLAAASGNLEITKMLLSAQADVNALDSSSRTPLHVAVTWRARDVITELLKQGADPHLVDLDLLTPMCYAARMADVDLLQFLVQNGIGVNDGACYEFFTPLHVAMRHGKWKVICFLLEHGADPCAKDIDGTVPLLLAARHGHASLVESLLGSLETKGEELNERDSTGNTLLHYAAANGWYTVVERLIELGVDVNRTDPKGFTALYYADQHRHSRIVSRLTKEGGLARWLTKPKLYRCPRIGRTWRD